VLSVAAPVFGWTQSIDEYTTRIHAWHYAERQIESGLRFLRHSAQSKRNADLQVQFADEAYRTADNLPDSGKQDMKLTKALRLEIENAIPPDYVWTAL
jgi:ferritin-like metal-binding protein YciE